MATELKLRRGTTAQHAAFTGAAAEVTVDTDKDTVVVHDGSTAGGFPLARANGSAINPTSVGATTAGTGAFTTLSATGVTTISTNSASDALRITQTGSGNALLVEDSANPDATPFVIDASGNVVVGSTTAPLVNLGTAGQFSLVAVGGPISQTISRFSANSSGPTQIFFKGRGLTSSDFAVVSSGDTLANIFFYGADGTQGISAASITASVDGTPGTNDMPGRLVFSTTADGAASPTERMRIDSSGNVGIGTSSPGSRLHVASSTSATAVTVGNSSGNSEWQQNGNDLFISNYNGSGAAIFRTNGTERMRIDSSGNLLVATTSSFNSAGSFQTPITASGRSGFVTQNTTTSLASAMLCLNSSGSYVGGIQVSNTATSFPTSSDYRLKHDIQPMTGALDKVAQLNPVTYKWNADDSDGQGFIAHELQAVVPDCVTGEKDAVERLGNILDAEGKVLQESVQEPTEESRIAGQTWVHIKDSPLYQGVDTSFLVATLVAAIQELKADFDAYKATHP
jgi:hypothetical protein